MATTKPLPKGSRITWFSTELLRNLSVAQKDAMAATVFRLSNKVKELMANSPRSGRYYVVGKTPTKGQRKQGFSRRMHRASGPGEPPAPNHGRLMNSVRGQVVVETTQGWEGRVGTDVRYAPPLEYGVKGAGRTHVVVRKYRVQTTREHTGEQGVIARTSRVLKSKTHLPLFGPAAPGGWRLAPRPAWSRALKEEWRAIVKLFTDIGIRLRGGTP